MSEMEPAAEEQDEEQAQSASEFDHHTGDEHSARSFFALISFFIAIIFLAIFISTPLNSINGLVVLLAIFAFGLGGIYLLTQQPAQEGSPSLASAAQKGKEGEQVPIVDSTLAGTGYEEEQHTETLSPFEILVEEALASIPSEFQNQMRNLVVIVESVPDDEVLRRAGTKEGLTLLGLYQGVPLTAYGRAGSMLPERITIFQRTIEAYCHNDPQRIREQVRSTVLHEVAHHFGIDHEEMPIWIR